MPSNRFHRSTTGSVVKPVSKAAVLWVLSRFFLYSWQRSLVHKSLLSCVAVIPAKAVALYNGVCRSIHLRPWHKNGDTRRKLVTSLEDTSNNHLFRRPSAGRGPAPLTILKSLGPDLCRDDEQKSMWRFATRRRLITTLKEASSNDIQRHQSVAPAKAGAQRL
jgi:hypothetical protein